MKRRNKAPSEASRIVKSDMVKQRGDPDDQRGKSKESIPNSYSRLTEAHI